MRAVCVLLLASLSVGCGGRTMIPPPEDEEPDAAAVEPPACDLDVLFVVDDSTSMGEEQAALADALPAMLAAMADAPVASAQLGVVTTDLGAGGIEVPTCEEPDGGDGLLRRRGADVDGCLDAYPAFLEFRPDAPSASAELTGRDLSCLTRAGTEGCGFEQPLEAALKAVTPADSPVRFMSGTTGHGDGENAGLLRDGSILAVVIVTDEDDCSVDDPGLFDPGDPRFEGPLNARCALHPEALFPLGRYVEGFSAVRPARLLVASIAGVPVDLVADPDDTDYEAVLADPRMRERLDPEGGRVLPVCDLPELGPASPARRLAALSRDLGDAGLLQSICQPDLSAPLEAVVRRVARIAGEAGCAPRD